jgi:hypothetical protein
MLSPCTSAIWQSLGHQEIDKTLTKDYLAFNNHQNYISSGKGKLSCIAKGETTKAVGLVNLTIQYLSDRVFRTLIQAEFQFPVWFLFDFKITYQLELVVQIKLPLPYYKYKYG